MDLEFKKKWGIMGKALVIMIILLVPRTLIDIYGYDTVPINPVVGAFITGAIFTIAIIFTGTFTDFKESEKTGGDLAASLKAMYNDACVLPITDDAPARALRAHVRDLHRTINTCFRENNFNLQDINREMNKVNSDIRTLAFANVAPPLIAKLRNELGAIFLCTGAIWCMIVAISASAIADLFRDNIKIQRGFDYFTCILFIGLGVGILVGHI